MKRLVLVLLGCWFVCVPVPVWALPPVPRGWQGTILIELQPVHDPALDVLVSDEATLVFEALAPSAKKPQPNMLLHGRINLARTAILIEARWLAPVSPEIIIEHLARTLEIEKELVRVGIVVTVFPDKAAVGAYFSEHVEAWIARPQ